MIKNITIGQYIPGETAIHRIDPRVKILATIAYISILFFVKDFFPYIYVLAYLGTVIWLSEISVKTILKSLKPLAVIIILTLVFNIFMTPGETVKLFGIDLIFVTKQGLYQAAYMGLRLLFLITGASLLTLTTSPIALTDGIEKLLSPFKKLGVPAHELAMMMTIALRFIPTLLDETDKIMKAQMARGADFESGNLFNRAKAMIPLMVPLFISAFRRAEELALAIEARCYRGGENRTRMKQLKLIGIDYSASIVTILLCIGIIFTR
ncbi:MAG: transporter [Clostridiales bacterium GWB2_37_7]|nr:MAG: transporter [Clostridiales bacterium GWB2_37_7]